MTTAEAPHNKYGIHFLLTAFTLFILLTFQYEMRLNLIGQLAVILREKMCAPPKKYFAEPFLTFPWSYYLLIKCFV